MTGRIIPLQGERHSDIQAILPWYAAGRLDEAEAARVRAHVAGCAECQADMASEQSLAAALADLPPESEGSALEVEAGWQAMRRRLDAEKAPSPGALTAWIAARGREWGGGAAWLRWAVAAQACLLLVGVGVLWRPAPPVAQYRALSSPAPQGGAAANVVLIFRPDVTEGEMRALLRASHARLVDGPTASDAYMVHVPAEERAATLEALRRHAKVALAEPMGAGG